MRASSYHRTSGFAAILLVCLMASTGGATPTSQPSEAGRISSSALAARADFWSFKPPIRPVLPAVQNSTWARNPIDYFILARLEQAKLVPQAQADRRTLIRRVSFDLVGLPPTPEEVDAFVDDKSPDAYESLVDRLLASPRYGERWARHWLDVVRFAESQGFEMNQPRTNAWPYRDYVIRAFNENKPYDRFVQEQIAGDALGVDEATGFLVAGPYDQVKSPDPVLSAQQRADELHDIVSTTSSTFLGLTVGCARCHDHKFDAIAQADYYRLTAIFAGVRHGERPRPAPGNQGRAKQIADLRRRVEAIDGQLAALEPLANPAAAAPSLAALNLSNGSKGPAVRQTRSAVQIGRNVDRFAPVDARLVRFTIIATNNGAAPCIDELEIWTPGPDSHNVALATAGARASASSTIPGHAIHQVSHLIDGLYGNGHSWISNEPGKGWAEVELPQKMRIDRVVWGRDREGKYLDRLATAYKIEVAVEPDDWRIVATSDDRMPYGKASADAGAIAGAPATSAEGLRLRDQRKARNEQIKALASADSVYAGQFEAAPQIHRLGRGDPMQPREVIAPGGIAALMPPLDLPPDAPEQQRRLTLARWITAPQNPLAARVMVNRLWQHHFGRGIIATPGDFGHMGVRPSHPQLLDWLATEFVSPSGHNARPWDMKALQRLIVTSATYRQSSAPSEAGISADADSILLWRYPPRRLEAEPIRDTILAVSGKLDLAMGGPGYDPFMPNSNYVRIYAPKEDFGPADWRRMVYQFKPRMQQDGTFGVFDCPDGGQVASKRTVSTTPLQALNLLNSGFMMQQAGFFAQRLHCEAGDDPAAEVFRAFRLALGRNPTDADRDVSVKFIREQGLVLFCRALFNANEFLYVP